MSQDQPIEEEIKEEAQKAVDPRHLERMSLLQALFIDEFPGQSWESLELKFDQAALTEIRNNKTIYDQEISQVAQERPLHDLARIDLAILRLILHESKTKATPVKVLIDEGVELAKDFGGEHSYAFINAVLEKLLLKKLAAAKDEDSTSTTTT